MPAAVMRAPSSTFHTAGPLPERQWERSVPSKRTIASDGALPGVSWVLGVPGVITGRLRAVAVVDVPLAAGEHRRVLVAELRLLLADEERGGRQRGEGGRGEGGGEASGHGWAFTSGRGLAAPARRGRVAP